MLHYGFEPAGVDHGIDYNHNHQLTINNHYEPFFPPFTSWTITILPVSIESRDLERIRMGYGLVRTSGPGSLGSAADEAVDSWHYNGIQWHGINHNSINPWELLSTKYLVTTMDDKPSGSSACIHGKQVVNSWTTNPYAELLGYHGWIQAYQLENHLIHPEKAVDSPWPARPSRCWTQPLRSPH